MTCPCLLWVTEKLSVKIVSWADWLQPASQLTYILVDISISASHLSLLIIKIFAPHWTRMMKCSIKHKHKSTGTPVFSFHSFSSHRTQSSHFFLPPLEPSEEHHCTVLYWSEQYCTVLYWSEQQSRPVKQLVSVCSNWKAARPDLRGGARVGL